jgi:hypothetical protein
MRWGGGKGRQLRKYGVRRIELHAAFIFDTGACVGINMNQGPVRSRDDKVL